MLDKRDEIDLDPDLLEKAEEILNLLNAGQSRVVVSGPAGTGKTQLIKHVVDHIEGRVHVVAYTGQAARMLQKRGIPATTIHQLIYLPSDIRREKIAAVKDLIKKAGNDRAQLASLTAKLDALLEPAFVLNDDSALNGARLCVLDEASMVGERLGDDLEGFGVPMLVVGDPYQLGPVDEEPCYDLSNPDVALSKILRQDADSRILTLATRVREGKYTDKYPTPVNKDDLVIREDQRMNNDQRRDFIMEAHRILCSTNETRRAVNRRVLRYFDAPDKRYPDGEWWEELICVRNSHDNDLLNGMPIRLRDVKEDGSPFWFTAEVLGDDEISRGRLKIYKGWFDYSLKRTPWNEVRKLVARELDAIGEPLLECDWGFCITTHKAQGSEWPRVLFLSESFPQAGEFRQRLHYSAITRASQRLVIIDGWGQRPSRRTEIDR